MPCLTPCLLTTHDIYLTSRNGFCGALQAHETLRTALTDRHGADRPNRAAAAARTAQIPVQPGSSCHHLQPFLSGCCWFSAFQQLRPRLVTAPGKAVLAPHPELGITSVTFPRLQAADGEAFPWLTPSITQRGSIQTPGRQRLFPGRHGRQRFHMPRTLYLSEALFLALRCICGGCNTLWCNVQHAFKTHFSIYCQAKCWEWINSTL